MPVLTQFHPNWTAGPHRSRFPGLHLHPHTVPQRHPCPGLSSLRSSFHSSESLDACTAPTLPLQGPPATNPLSCPAAGRPAWSSLNGSHRPEAPVPAHLLSGLATPTTLLGTNPELDHCSWKALACLPSCSQMAANNSRQRLLWEEVAGGVCLLLHSSLLDDTKVPKGQGREIPNLYRL